MAQKKAKKVGRPRLPKGFAKGKIVPVRFAPGAIKAIEAAANASGQTTSDWVRTAIQTVLTSRELLEESSQLLKQSDELVTGRKRQSEGHSK